jgi:hypothetical protein
MTCEVYWLLAVVCMVMFSLSPLLAENKLGTGGSPPVH